MIQAHRVKHMVFIQGVSKSISASLMAEKKGGCARRMVQGLCLVSLLVMDEFGPNMQ